MSEQIREFVPETAVPEKISVPMAKMPPMAWHRFLTRFMLPVAALYHLFQAVWILLGKVYYTAAARDAVYAGLPGMRILDYALAALMLAAAAALLCARGRLAKLQAKGIKLLVRAYILLTLSWLAYGPARCLIAGLGFLSIPVVGQAAAYFALAQINRIYYARRRDLFKAEN